MPASTSMSQAPVPRTLAYWAKLQSSLPPPPCLRSHLVHDLAPHDFVRSDNLSMRRAARNADAILQRYGIAQRPSTAPATASKAAAKTRSKPPYRATLSPCPGRNPGYSSGRSSRRSCSPRQNETPFSPRAQKRMLTSPACMRAALVMQQCLRRIRAKKLMQERAMHRDKAKLQRQTVKGELADLVKQNKQYSRLARSREQTPTEPKPCYLAPDSLPAELELLWSGNYILGGLSANVKIFHAEGDRQLDLRIQFYTSARVFQLVLNEADWAPAGYGPLDAMTRPVLMKLCDRVCNDLRDSNFGPNQVRAVPIFKNLSAEVIEKLCQQARSQSHAAGEVICRQGAYGDEMHFVEKGTCDVFIDGNKIGKLQTGSYFGELALLSAAGTRTSSVIAATECVTQVIRRDCFADIMRCHPEVKAKLIQQRHYMYSPQPKVSTRKLKASDPSTPPEASAPMSLTTKQANRLRRVDTAIRVNQGACLTRKTDSSYDLRQPFIDAAAGENTNDRRRRISTVAVDRIVPL